MKGDRGVVTNGPVDFKAPGLAAIEVLISIGVVESNARRVTAHRVRTSTPKGPLKQGDLTARREASIQEELQ